MFTPISGKRRRHKRFNYQPKYYDPDKDPAKRVGKRIKLQSKSSRGQNRSVIIIAALLIALLYIFTQL